MRALACVGLAGMLLAGCASAGGTSDLIAGEAPQAAAPAAGGESAAVAAAAGTQAPPPSSASAIAGLSRAAPAPKGREREPEKPYPSFGAPAQVGDRPVLTPQQREAMQKNLESLAQQRAQELLRDIEADQ